MKETDNIQDLFSKAFENHTASVRPEVWQGVQAKMAASGVAGTAAVKGLSSLTKWIIGAGITGSVGLATTVLVMNSGASVDKPTKNITANKAELSPSNDKTIEAVSMEGKTHSTSSKQTYVAHEGHMDDLVPSLVDYPIVDEVFEEKVPNPVIVSHVNKVNVTDNKADKTTPTPVTNESTIHSSTPTPSSTEVKEVKVENKTVITKNPPNIFSPNNDRENDEYFFESENIKEFHVFILNEQNKLVFESDDENFKWDGTWNGTPCEEGKFICVLTGKDTEGKWFKKMWNLELKR